MMMKNNSDSINNASSLALSFHKERRDYIKHQLKQTLCVFENQEYFGNKFQVWNNILI